MDIQPTEKEIVDMLNDTSQIVANDKARVMMSATSAWEVSDATADNIEFWKWMNRNYSGASGHMFSSNADMKQYVAESQGKADWIRKQLQGKGYEWDWMSEQRKDIRNIFKRYTAGDVSNQVGYDVVEKNILTGHEKQYQMKAYTSKKNPDLHNTSRDIEVVTNAEKVEIVRNNGYEVQEFKNNQEIIDDTDERMLQIDKGYAAPEYNFQNISLAMAKAGAMGCVIGMGMETVGSYRQWKQGTISDDEYLNKVIKAGGESGITAAASAGIMIPVSSLITAAGVSSLVTIPVAFVVSAAVNQIVAPCFGGGKYSQILGKAKYYQNLEDVYDGFIRQASYAAEEYTDYVRQVQSQSNRYEQTKRKNLEVNKKLKDLYDSI
jgi:hypothetical protein